MTHAEEQLTILRAIFARPLSEYITGLELEANGTVDSSYCYDMANLWVEQENISWSQVLDILAEQTL